MHIETYTDFQRACTKAKNVNYNSPIATMWKQKSLEYIRHNYSESAHSSCHSKLYPLLYVVRTNIEAQNKYLENIDWIEEYIAELHRDGDDIKFTKSKQQPNENISSQYTYHEEILKHAEKPIKIKNYNDAVKECCIAFEEYVKKYSKSQLTGKELMSNVFKPTRPILKFNNNKLNDETINNVQEGLKFLAMGMICHIRNPMSHTTKFNYKFTDDEAIEILHFISYLFRIVDKTKYSE